MSDTQELVKALKKIHEALKGLKPFDTDNHEDADILIDETIRILIDKSTLPQDVIEQLEVIVDANYNIVRYYL